jgi:hypothetical protein
MANRENFPASLFPLRGDVSAEAGAVKATVIGIQTTPVSPNLPTDGQVLVYVQPDLKIEWKGGFILVNSPTIIGATANPSPNISTDYEVLVDAVWACNYGYPLGVKLNGVDPTVPIVLLSSTKYGSAAGGTSPAISTTGASLLVIALTDYLAGADTIIPTDTYGNTWAHTTATGTSAGGSDICLWYAVNPIVGNSHTFTISAAGGFPSICVAAFSGVKTSSPLDQQHGAIAAQPGSITPIRYSELVLSYMGASSAGSAAACSGFTIIQDQPYTAGVCMGSALAYFVQTVPMAQNPTWSGAGVDVSGIASFFHS